MVLEQQGLDAWIESVESRIAASAQVDTNHACDLEHGIACIHCQTCGAFLGLDSPAAWARYWAGCKAHSHSVTGEHTMGRIMNHG